MKGSYVLILKLNENKTINIGKLGKIDLEKGFYIYVGSALNSLEARINRHLRRNKKIHWHIDYLLDFAFITDVFLKEKSFKEECRIAQIFEEKLISIKGFGCSDCRCRSHLFYGNYNEIIGIVKNLNLEKYLLREKP